MLITEAVNRPTVSRSCNLRFGRWVSQYDGDSVRNDANLDIDHLIPLHEAWQSGAWRWTKPERRGFANDLGYRASLLAVTVASNRSKGDREPQDWMPGWQRCRYLGQWVAVKTRWQLKVNKAERSFLEVELQVCGWPRVPKPGRGEAEYTAGGGSGGGGGGSGGGGGGTDPRYQYCTDVIAAGLGPLLPRHRPGVPLVRGRRQRRRGLRVIGRTTKAPPRPDRSRVGGPGDARARSKS